MKKIFISGGTGLVGSSIVKELARNKQSNYEIIVSYRSKNGIFLDDPKVSYSHTNLADFKSVIESSRGCDMAIMCGGYVAGSVESQKEPWKQVGSNLQIESNQLEAFHENEISNVVYCSSASLYQESELPLKEEDLDFGIDPPKGQFGVGWVKRYGEKSCEFWANHTEMRFKILRLTNVYGIGAKFDRRSSNFIPALVSKFCDYENPIEVFGNIGNSRDIIFSTDVARAISGILLDFDEKIEVFNLGYGGGVSVSSVIDHLIQYSGRSRNDLVFRGNTVDTPKTRLFDCSKITSKSGWKPEISPEVGIKILFDWWSKNQCDWKR